MAASSQVPADTCRGVRPTSVSSASHLARLFSFVIRGQSLIAAEEAKMGEKCRFLAQKGLFRAFLGPNSPFSGHFHRKIPFSPDVPLPYFNGRALLRVDGPPATNVMTNRRSGPSLTLRVKRSSPTAEGGAGARRVGHSHIFKSSIRFSSSFVSNPGLFFL